MSLAERCFRNDDDLSFCSMGKVTSSTKSSEHSQLTSTYQHMRFVFFLLAIHRCVVTDRLDSSTALQQYGRASSF